MKQELQSSILSRIFNLNKSKLTWLSCCAVAESPVAWSSLKVSIVTTASFCGQRETRLVVDILHEAQWSVDPMWHHSLRIHWLRLRGPLSNSEAHIFTYTNHHCTSLIYSTWYESYYKMLQPHYKLQDMLTALLQNGLLISARSITRWSTNISTITT